MAPRTTRSSGRKKQSRKRKLSINMILWIAVVLIILFYTTLNLKTITTTISRLQGKTPSATNKPDDAPPPPSETAPKPASQTQSQNTNNTETAQPENDSTESEEFPQQGDTDTSQYTSYVYFAQTKDDGSFYLRKIPRTIGKTQAVLRKTLQELFAGPTPEEQAQGVRSFIPPASIVQSVSIKNRIAYVTISDGFLFNSMGKFATDAQVYQLVYTGTEFATIDSVQILIDGKNVSYLGGEGGIFVGNPITRVDLSPIPVQ